MLILRVLAFGLPVTILAIAAVAQSVGSRLSGKTEGFGLIEMQVLNLDQYNGFAFVTTDTTVSNNTGHFEFENLYGAGFYRLKIPVLGIDRDIYLNGQSDVEITIVNTGQGADEFHFEDAENRALKELLRADEHLEVALNTLLEHFNPAQIDSFYFQRVPSHNKKVLEAYRQFSASLANLRAKYPKTRTANLFASFFQVPLFDEDAEHGKYYDNQNAYMRDHFFDLWKLNEPDAIHLPEIKARIEKYFRYFAKRDHRSLTMACDNIVGRADNDEVRRHLASVLMEFFGTVKENDVVIHIVENILNGCLDGIDADQISFTRKNLRHTKVSDLVLPSENGIPLRLSDIYNMSDVTVLYFWTPDCIHCQDLHPYVKNVNEKFKGKVGIYSVCLEDDEQKWRDALNEHALNINTTVASDEGRKRVSEIFNISYTPMVFIIDGTGEIVDKDVQGEELMEKTKAFVE